MSSTDLGKVITGHTDRLRRAGVPSPDVDARLLAAHVFGDELRAGATVEEDQLVRLSALVDQRAQRIPLQHLVGATWFRHVRLLCRPGVFIPRPETEVVAGHAIDAARACAAPVVVEPCTGSGAIAAAVASEVPHVRIVATDRSPVAVALASDNLARVVAGTAGAPPATDVDWAVHEGDLFAPVPVQLCGQVDVVVANPPYMPARDRAGWEPEVALHDPVEATVGGIDGHEVVERVLREAREWLRSGGTLVTEIDERRGPETADLARRLGYRDVGVRQDLTGADRAVLATWPGRIGSSEARPEEARP